MTTTYDPYHPQYLDEGDVRAELTRVYDLCHGCRLCVNLCSSFPTLFELIDRDNDQGAAKLTKAEQDQVVDECFQCKLCYLNCPYVPGQSEWNLDFPRLMLRAAAMRTATGAVPARRRLTNSVMGRTDLVGKLAVRAAPLANATVEKPGSVSRKVLQALTGVSAVRVLPPYAKQRFTTWFKQRPKVRIEHRQGKVAVFPTCLVEYQNPGIGHDLVKVYERNGVECEVVDKAKCCGAPWLHAGEVERFTKQARENVGLLAAAVRAGNDIVVAQPTCGYVLKRDYVDYVGGADATARGEADLRRLRVPDAGPQGRRHQPRHQVPRRRPRDHRLPRALPPAGPGHRAEEPGPPEADRSQDHPHPGVLGHRRHVGAASRERRAVDAARQEAGRPDRAGRLRGGGRRLHTWPTAPSPNRPAVCPTTRCR